ncbi:MAG: S8 family serine peptidase, partial [Chloroflexales bacterium]|nr:S8 family serine peptidase [Chloroflexales bacterium]
RMLDLAVVAYMPNNAYVVWGQPANIAKLQSAVAAGPPYQWSGAYAPAMRLAPSLHARAGSPTPGAMVDVTVQVYTTKGTPQTLAEIQALGGGLLSSANPVLNLTNLSLQVPEQQLWALAARPDVFNVEPFIAPARNDEAQGQMLAGNFTTSGGNVVPTGPGYLAWLSSLGFPTSPADYPIVDVTDDGVDQGNPAAVVQADFYELGSTDNPDRIIYAVNCTTDPSANGIAGHGNLNAGIVGGYNNRSGFPYEDAQGYNFGLGVAPYTRLANTKIFANSGSYSIANCGGTVQGVVRASYTAGARITSNSWGADVGGAYTADSQAYDALTRDALPASGNQEILHVFSAGNAGPGASTIGSPGTAKNVLTVGANENVRDEGTPDGCGTSAANNADDMATFSSRGPTDDGRVKPDVTAAGTHVQGPAGQPGFSGAGVCGASTNDFTAPGTDAYYPPNQTLYSWSSGTSHSAPAISGAASLAYEYYRRVLGGGEAPSPAMLKGLLIHEARFLSGAGAGTALPSNGQGWGTPNLGSLFADTTKRTVLDQSITFGATGEEQTFTGTIVDPGQPLRVTLVWTDAPGSTSGNAYVNNLNLEVTVGGATYRGNVFSGGHSTTGGSADSRNNVENVFLPAALSGPVAVRVRAGNIAGDGVPGNSDTTDQDFALIVSNVDLADIPVLGAGVPTFSDVSGGDGDGVIEPGETVSISIPWSNGGTGPATGISGTIAVTGGSATLVSATSAYPDLSPGQTGANLTAYSFTIDPNFPCGSRVSFRQTLTYSGGDPLSFDFSTGTGQAVLSTPTSYAYSGAAVPITDNATASVTINVSAPGVTIGDLDVRFDATHTFDGDLEITLIAPSGTTVLLANRRGAMEDNFTGTIFDDEGATAIGAGSAPFTGRFSPEEPLAALDGQAASGTWTLQVRDLADGDVGSITGASLDIASRFYLCNESLLQAGTAAFSDAQGNNNGVVDPGEPVTISIPWTNQGTSAATSVSGTVAVTEGGATMADATSAYPDIDPGATRANSTPYRFVVGNTTQCGTSVSFEQNISYSGGRSASVSFSTPVGQTELSAPTTYPYNGTPPLPVPINDLRTVTIAFDITAPGLTIGDLDVRFDAMHTWTGDLEVSLISPLGTTVSLASRRGSSGHNFTGTIFDDQAATPIGAGAAPFTGSFRPETPLSVLNDTPLGGTWTLRVQDMVGGDTGRITGFALDARVPVISCDPLISAPEVSAGPDVSGSEGAPLALSGSVVSAGDDSVTASWSYAPGAGVDAGASCSFTDASAPATSITCTDDGSYTATLSASDGVNPAVTDSATVTLSNAAPVVAAVSTSPSTVYVGDVVTVAAGAYSDAGANDEHIAAWNLDDGTTYPLPAGGGSVAGVTHTYSETGIYSVRLTVTDDNGGIGTAATSVTVQPMCADAEAFDGFDRANGSIGSRLWAGLNSLGAYRIVGKQVDVQKGGMIYWRSAAFGRSQFACLTLTQIDPASQRHTIVLKSQPGGWGNGVILVSYNAVGRTIDIEIRDRATRQWRQIGSFPAAVAAGDQLAARARADGNVQAYVNNTLVGSADAGPFYAGRGGRIGVWYQQAASAVFDNFIGGSR